MGMGMGMGCCLMGWRFEEVLRFFVMGGRFRCEVFERGGEVGLLVVEAGMLDMWFLGGLLMSCRGS